MSLIAAVKEGNIELARMLIRSGADLDEKDSTGKTPLLSCLHRIALSYNKASEVRNKKVDMQILDLLLVSGATVDAKGQDKETALHFAATIPRVEIFQKLMNAGAKELINCQDYDGLTPMHCAVWYGNSRVLSLLIRLKADVNARNLKDRTPLHLSVAKGKKELVSTLINAGAKLNIRDAKSMTPLLLAFHTILKRADNETILREGKDSADFVVEENYLEIVNVLIDARADVNCQIMKSRKTALHMAAILPSEEIFLKLLAAGAEVNLKHDELGFTPLHHAVRHGNTKILGQLIKFHAYINVRDWYYRTPLHIAVSSGRPEIVKKLLKIGANFEVRDRSGKTPLLFALSAILHWHGNSDILRNTGSCAWVEVRREDLKILKLLLHNDADIKVSSNDGKTALHYAALMPDKRVCRMILNVRNACKLASQRDNAGRTPVHYAQIYKNREVLRLLVEAVEKDRTGLNLFKIAARLYRRAVARCNTAGRSHSDDDNGLLETTV